MVDENVLGKFSSDNGRRKFLKQAGLAAASLPFARSVAALELPAPRPSSQKSGISPRMVEIPDYMVYAQLPDGKLIGLLGGLEKGHAVGRYSSDGGETFGPTTHLFPLDESIGSWSLHNAFLDRDGELQLLYTNDANTLKQNKSFYEIHFDIWHVRSTNARKQWRAPKRVWEGYAGSLLSFVQLKNGRVLVPYTYLTARTWANRGKGFDAYAFNGRFSSSSAYSDDQGSTWYVSPTELKESTPMIGQDGGIEPIVLELKDGRVWMLIRTQWGRFYESYSVNGGETWTPPVPTAIISGDSPCSLTRLPDGRIVMLWNNNLRYCYANGGRAVLHGAISEDEGRSWRGYREVAANPLVYQPPPPNGDHGVTYTVPALTSEGHLITSLTIGPGGGYYLLKLDPEWFYETKRSHSFEQGLIGWSTFGTQGVEVLGAPESSGRPVLQIKKTGSEWPAAGVWNFPAGKRGDVRLRVLIRDGFAGGVIGLTDHFSVPFDSEDIFHNVANLDIGPGGKLQGGERLTPGRWHDLLLRWDTDRHQCLAISAGKTIARCGIRRDTVGPSYLRIRSTALDKDPGGILIQSVSADSGAGWA
ncbi:MAG TPA: sialidase family protein [Terriglobales bacterium]|nr:sialidase family protein [Terriglobales bacterium]